ncbi:Putative transmembrane protein [Caenispirillum salinarum AK4]|uniref:Putative transmembrane protein n=1 Tax=Caenispirillum salinarum AK4 TaxID=1238182 RepID=K9GQH3_9PROT|nr:DUF924 family protein [Caenispirillum salinarum]EKV26994.1 Putative transmembrane protein [Caenispirillum salinarum AK4]
MPYAARTSGPLPSETVARVVAFWFGEPGSPTEGEPRKEWFVQDDAFDQAIAERFTEEMDAAADGRLDGLMATPLGCVTLVILLDQFPRNVFRNSPAAFACDQKARTVTRHALEQGFDADLRPVHRLFLYMPLEHSECLSDQEASVELFRQLGNAEWLDYAIKHRDLIARFDRFPHRNAVLGRASTPEEEAFLADHGRGF